MASTLPSNPPSHPPTNPSPSTKPNIPPRPPKSKTEPYYSIHPTWSDIKPIPQADLTNPSTYTTLTSTSTTPISQSSAQALATAGPALATIAYTPRYAEAMSYLRAVMLNDEKSQRALDLTEDIIGMNAAHYTVWIYRMDILRGLWRVTGKGRGGNGGHGQDVMVEEEDQERISKAVEGELRWLERVSEQHLKNYQIWHHRTSLLSLLPTLPKNEQSFLSQILSLDTKNYHVWSYRQWLCTRFPTDLLENGSELKAMDKMISEDALNNSAWNHRWWIVFGAEASRLEKQQQQQKQSTISQTNKDIKQKPTTTKILDLEIIDRELEFTKSNIRLYPQNGSSWNYLKGIIKHASIPVTEFKEFCGEFVGRHASVDSDKDGGDTTNKYDFFVINTDNTKGVRSSQAIEMLIDIFDVEGNRDMVREGLRSLSEVWDPIREKYWGWRLGRFEERWNKEE